MSLEAVNWLGSKLGINISGHEEEHPSDVGHSTDFSQTNSADFYTSSNSNANNGRGGDTMENVKATLGGFWKSASEKVSSMIQPNKGPTYNDIFGGGGGSPTGGNEYQQHQQQQQQQSGGYNMNMGGGGGGGVRDNEAGENTELDENGFPVSKNWYYFDKTLNRWNVTPDAPESIRRDYERKLQEAEDERLGIKKVVAPPPPPGASRPPGAPPPSAQGGLFHGNAAGGNRPMYAVPDYFSSNPAPQHQQYQQYQQPPPPQQQQQQQPGYNSYTNMAPQTQTQPLRPQQPPQQQQQQQQFYPQQQQQQPQQPAPPRGYAPPPASNYATQPTYQGQMSYNTAPAQPPVNAQNFSNYNPNSGVTSSSSGTYPTPPQPQQTSSSQGGSSVHSTPNPNPTPNTTNYSSTQQASVVPPSAPPPRPAPQNPPPSHALPSTGSIASRYAPSPFDTMPTTTAPPPSGGGSLNTFHPSTATGAAPPIAPDARKPPWDTGASCAPEASNTQVGSSVAYNPPPPFAPSEHSATAPVQTQSSNYTSSPIHAGNINASTGTAALLYQPANTGSQNMNPFASQPTTTVAASSTGYTTMTTTSAPQPQMSNPQAPPLPPQTAPPPSALPSTNYSYTGMNYTSSSGNGAAPPAFKPFTPK